MGTYSLKDWDNQAKAFFEQVGTDLGAAKRGVPATLVEIDKQLSAINESQSTILAHLERLILLSTPTAFLRGEERSLTHWATKFSEQVQDYLREFGATVPMEIWGELITRRLVGSDSMALDDRPLTVLSLSQVSDHRKKKNLKKEELLSGIRDLEAERKKLVRKYNRLVVVRSNRDASGSMQRWGSLGSLAGPADSAPRGHRGDIFSISSELDRLFVNASIGIRGRVNDPSAEEYRSAVERLGGLPRIQICERAPGEPESVCLSSYVAGDLADLPPPDVRSPRRGAESSSSLLQAEAEMSEIIGVFMSEMNQRQSGTTGDEKCPDSDERRDAHLVNLSNHAAATVPEYFRPAKSL